MEGFEYHSPLDQNYVNREKVSNQSQECSQSQNANSPSSMSKSQLAHLRESPAAKERRLARNAERMREKRAAESFDEYRKRLDKNAMNNRLKRQQESLTEKAMRQVRDAARQRLRRAMEDPEQRAKRLRKLAERMRLVRQNESPEKKAVRLAKAAQRARERLQNETEEERKIRLQKSLEYARRIRSSKSMSASEGDSSMTDYEHLESFNNDLEKRNQNFMAESNQQVIYQDQGYQQQVITIPAVREKTGSGNFLKIGQVFSLPPGYSYVKEAFVKNPNSREPFSKDYNQFYQSNEPNVIIQPIVTTLNIPQYHSSGNPPRNFNNHQIPNQHAHNAHQIQQFQFQNLSEAHNPSQKNIQTPQQIHNSNQNQKFPQTFNTQNSQIPIKVEHETTEEIQNYPSGNMVERLVKVEIIDVPKLPKRLKKTEEERLERLRITAEKSRVRRQNETPEQRKKRLFDLRTRARKRRDEIKMNESEEERKLRLQKQAEYARTRRMRVNTREGKEKIERKARELYAKIHENSQSSEKPSVLKILEPIIEMNTLS